MRQKKKVLIVRNHLKATKARQKSYADCKRKDVSYEASDKVFQSLTLEEDHLFWTKMKA